MSFTRLPQNGERILDAHLAIYTSIPIIRLCDDLKFVLDSMRLLARQTNLRLTDDWQLHVAYMLHATCSYSGSCRTRVKGLDGKKGETKVRYQVAN